MVPTTWYIARDGKQHGPITEAEFRRFLELGHLLPDDLVWHDGAPDWISGATYLGQPIAIAAPVEDPQKDFEAAAPEAHRTFLGAIGGAQDAAPKFLVRKQWGTMAVALGVILGFIVWQAINVGGDQKAAQPTVDRVLLERQLLSNPDMRWLHVLKDRDASAYKNYVDTIVSRARSGEALEATINYARGTIVESLFAANAQHMSDDATNSYIRLVGDQMEELTLSNPRLCARALRNEPLGNTRQYVSQRLVARELQLLETAVAVDKRQTRPRYSKADQEKLIAAIVKKMVLEHGDRTHLLDPSTSKLGREQEACIVSAAFFRELLSLPPAQSAALMRSFPGNRQTVDLSQLADPTIGRLRGEPVSTSKPRAETRRERFLTRLGAHRLQVRAFSSEAIGDGAELFRLVRRAQK